MQQHKSPDVMMMEMLLGFQKSFALVTAASLRLADHVEAGANTVAQLATITGTIAERLARLLRALSQIGVFTLEQDGRVGMTLLSETLRSNQSGSPHWAALMLQGPQGQVWNLLEESLRTPGLPFERVTGSKLFEWIGANVSEADIFHRGMISMYGSESEAIAMAYDFTSVRTVVDLGGGNGHLLSAILARYPHVRGILFEQAHALRAAKEGQGGSLPNTILVEGDFFVAVPGGADVYILRHVLHDWTDDECVAILRNCIASMKAGARLLIIEALIDCTAPPLPAPWGDLDMMLITGGEERSFEAYRDLCVGVGFSAVALVPEFSPVVSIIEAIKPE